jgi:hypothetical protein
MGLIIQKCDPLEATAPQKQLPGVVRYCQIAVAAAKFAQRWQMAAKLARRPDPQNNPASDILKTLENVITAETREGR